MRDVLAMELNGHLRVFYGSICFSPNLQYLFLASVLSTAYTHLRPTVKKKRINLYVRHNIKSAVFLFRKNVKMF